MGEEGEEETVPLNEFAQGDATLAGVEGRLEAEVVRHVALGVMGDLVRGELLGGMRGEEPLPFLPPARAGALARYDNGRLSAGAEVRYAFAQSRVPSAVIDDDPSAVATDAYTLVNLSLGYNLFAGGRVHAVTLRVDNLADERYQDAASRIKHFASNPGRNVSLVYRLLF